jgi:hypothetical protein
MHIMVQIFILKILKSVSRTKFFGVQSKTPDRWTAGFSCYLGSFDTPVEAAIAYDEAARLVPGKRLNFPQESSIGGSGNGIASLVVPLVPSFAEVPTEGNSTLDTLHHSSSPTTTPSQTYRKCTRLLCSFFFSFFFHNSRKKIHRCLSKTTGKIHEMGSNYFSAENKLFGCF